MVLTTTPRRRLALLCSGILSLQLTVAQADMMQNDPVQNNNDNNNAPIQNNNNVPIQDNVPVPPTPAVPTSAVPTLPTQPNASISQQDGFHNNSTFSTGVSNSLDTLGNGADPVNSGVTEGQGDGPGTLRSTLSPSDLHWIIYSTYDFGKLKVKGPNGIETNSNGGSLGMLYRVSPSLAFGGSLGGLSSKGEMNSGTGGVRTEGLTMAAFGVMSFGGTFVDLLYSASLLDNQFSRNPAGTNAGAKTSANVQTIALTLGHNRRFGNWVVGPRLGFNYSHWSQKGYTESGTGTLFAYPHQNSESLVTRVEWYTSYDIPVKFGTITPRSRIGWHRETMGGAGASNVELVGGGVVPSSGVNRVRNYLLASAGICMNFNQQWKASADYTGQFLADNFQVHNVSVMLSYAF